MQAFFTSTSSTLARLLRVPGTARAFSTSEVAQSGYKLKSHSGTKKRWRSLGSGDAFKRGHAGKGHLNVSKGAARVNRLGNTAYSSGAQTPKLKKVLLPYGTS